MIGCHTLAQRNSVINSQRAVMALRWPSQNNTNVCRNSGDNYKYMYLLFRFSDTLYQQDIN